MEQVRTWKCSRCRQDKTAEYFSLSRVQKGQRSGGYCKTCRSAVRDLKKEYVRARDGGLKQWRARHRANWLRRKYGLTVTEYQAILARQGGVCACCKSPDPGAGRDWRVDHSHESGLVRGLLCHHCNVGIGHLGDGPPGVQRALHYLMQPDTAGVSAGLLF